MHITHFTLEAVRDGKTEYIGKTPIREQALHVAETYRNKNRVSVIVCAHCVLNDGTTELRRVAYNADGTKTILWQTCID